MARPREFDTSEVLEKAMNVFWTRGYEDASLPDLLEGMELSRGSLYKAFKDKKSLFLQALEHYESEAVDSAVNMLHDTQIPNGWDRITGLFETVTATWDAGNRRGCLLCSAAAGPASYDPEIATAVAQGLAKMRAGFAHALDHHPEGYADLLVTQYVGLRVLCRSNVAPDVIKNNLKALHSLRPV